MLNSPSVWGALSDLATFGALPSVGSGAPISGPAPYGTGAGSLGPGSTYMDVSNFALYVNEGTAASPYWSPITIDHTNLLSWWTQFTDGAGKALSDTAALATLSGSGVRVFGDGIAATDSGLVVAMGSGVPIASLTASATNNKVAALGVGTTLAIPFSPTLNGTIVIDAVVSMSSAITLRRFFIGFLGTSADALVSPVTGTTLTLTNVQTDMAGLMYDANMTAASELFATHNKANDTPTLSSVLADTTVAFPAAGTYTRLRVEVDSAGNAAYFKDKVLVARFALALTPATMVTPTLLVATEEAVTKTMLVKQFVAWGKRV